MRHPNDTPTRVTISVPIPVGQGHQAPVTDSALREAEELAAQLDVRLDPRAGTTHDPADLDEDARPAAVEALDAAGLPVTSGWYVVTGEVR